MTSVIPRHGGAPLHTFPPRIRQLALPPGRRILAVSDVHGSLCYLKGLLEKAAFSPDDILILVGDLLEKGPDSLAVLRYIISLSETHTVHFVTGNCDWWYPFLYQVGSPESNLWYFQHAPNCLLRQMCNELGIAPGPDMDYLRLRDTAAEAFPREFDFLRRAPEILETPHYTFVHGGLPPGEPANWDAWNCLKYDSFLTCGRTFEKWVVVGHWPVMLYRDIEDASPLIDLASRIVSIDGGCVLREEGQLNALIIPEDGSEAFSHIAYDRFPLARVKRGQRTRAQRYYIRWGDAAVEVLERGAEFSRIRHLHTGYEMDVLTSRIRRVRNGTTIVNDSTDYVLPLDAGDLVSVVTETSRGSFVKRNGVCGWYFGELEYL
ncbi:MAG: metallophosphoesterase [Oscillospiraceae bacterium]|nr:metallophosphoesterase [Oscillospiraceae bacterium]